jgi:hypothetical protein
MQDIAEKLKSFSSQAGEGINKGLDVLKSKASEAGDYLQANPTLAAMLLAGGGSGLLGGYLTSQQAEEEGESKSQRRGRILRNALLAGGAGAGAVGLGAAGLKRLSEATPSGSENPVQEKLTSPMARALGGAGGAALGFSRGSKADTSDIIDQARRFLVKKKFDIKGRSPEEILALAETEKFKPSPDKLTGAVGNLNKTLNDPKLIDNLAKIFGKDRAAAIAMQLNNKRPEINSAMPKIQKALNTILGTSRAGRYARLGGLGGVLLPEIIGGAKDLALSAG